MHTGQYVTLTFKPAKEDYGVKFKRIDLDDTAIVNACVSNVIDTSRGTNLEQNKARVMTVEHILAAINGLGIDNINIEMDGSEIPILDGSSKPFIEVLLKAGIISQNKDREYFELLENISYSDPKNKIEIIAIPCDEYKVSVMIDYDTKVLGTQHATMNKIEDFKDEIAPSRTFVFLHELEYLLQNNLIKGGDVNNAIVFVNKIVSQQDLDKLADLFNKPRIKVLNEGILNNIELHHQNEPARHKLLDVVGDLSLIGTPIKAHIIATHPGHFANIQFAKLIKNHIDKLKSKPQPLKYDLNKPPLFDIQDIKKKLPHRPPFLLVDRILEMNDTEVIGLKNVTMNEGFFEGHFPNEPVMPGVLVVEAMAQAGGILMMSSVPDPENYITLFLKIVEVRFRDKVVPGDTLIFHLNLLSPIRRGICHMNGKAYVGNKVVTEAELLARIVKKK